MGVLERRQVIVAALEQAGYSVLPSEDLAGVLARIRELRPSVVAVSFRGRDVPFRFACFADDTRVSLRFGLNIRARIRHCQEWNSTKMFSKAYADKDGELALDYDYALIGPWSDTVFLENVRIFVASAMVAAMWFEERARFGGRDLLRWAVWVFAGLGARGLTLSTLCGEQLAAWITGTSSPLPRCLASPIHQARD